MKKFSSFFGLDPLNLLATSRLKTAVSFLRGNVFMLLFIEVTMSLSSLTSVVNLTAACVRVKHRDAFNLRSFLQENVFMLLFIEGHNVFLLFDIALVKACFTRRRVGEHLFVISATCPVC